MDLEVVHQCILPESPYEFIVIGTGGTGGHLIPNLARLISIVNKGQDKHRLVLVDGDEVEEKNISRQNFIHRDIGKNKAEVLGQRYSSAFGIPIKIVPKYLEKDTELYNLVTNNEGRISVIIGCVDNNKTRKLIHTVFYSQSLANKVFWIDSGNEEFTGQVVLGYNYQYDLAFSSFDFSRPNRAKFFLPPVTSMYPDIINDDSTKFNSELSCADRAISAPQSISANLTASNIIMNFANLMLTHKVDEGLKTHQVRFNCKNNIVNTDLLTQNIISKFPSVCTELSKASKLVL